MPPSNKVWTLDDVEHGRLATVPTPRTVTTEGTKPSAASSSSASAPVFLKALHIPNLPSSDYAKSLLERVVREFEPIAQQRGYNIRSVSELCCCGDGLDFDPSRRSRQRLRLASNDIWGYNQTSWIGRAGKKSHTIHLRLRHAGDHARFHEYTDVAGTLAHELAHCEHGPHNQAFYQLMDDILDQHAVLMAAHVTRQNHSVPVFSGAGVMLGRRGGGGHVKLSIRDKRLGYLEQQQQKQSLAKGCVLGGDASFTQWMTPAEAAVVAAEARALQQQMRLRGDRCCRPCVVPVEDSDNDDDDDDGAIQVAAGNRNQIKDSTVQPVKAASGTQLAKRQKRLGVKERSIFNTNIQPATKNIAKIPIIDLTGKDDNDNKSIAAAKSAAETKRSKAVELWSCSKCTFFNQPIALACSMCYNERQFKE